MNIVYLLLGSNLNDRSASLECARNTISGCLGKILIESTIYESEPWGFQSDNPFLNQVIKIATPYNPYQIIELIREIENRLGRTRDLSKGYISRIIDIDILFFNDDIISDDRLIIPHPKIQDRMFTLVPLNELDKSLMHPGSLKTVGELMNECQDTLKVYPYQPIDPQ
jgi:2-amino-4-hydroxy-6-hydroxymethyldihydropteridine diphosphokinase